MPDKPRDIEADAIALLEIARERGGNLPWVRATIADGLRSKAAAMRADADAEAGRLERLADKIANGDLTVREHSPTVNRQMQAVHRLAISRGRAGGDRFLLHIGQAKPKAYSLRSLAKAVGVSAPTLRAHRLPKSDPNHRPCPTLRAKQVERLTGWPADAAHWPAGLSD